MSKRLVSIVSVVVVLALAFFANEFIQHRRIKESKEAAWTSLYKSAHDQLDAQGDRNVDKVYANDLMERCQKAIRSVFDKKDSYAPSQNYFDRQLFTKMKQIAEKEGHKDVAQSCERILDSIPETPGNEDLRPIQEEINKLNVTTNR